ncbi:MAG: hypothetical protein EZS28_013762 [Streblomastix strix]|uniref:Uncharacterized protein n=1 Tax=Streblomastix strix TaxID=222440 RepID=A0A5J4W7V4_9EUKA|nr:MAG: hypothetical protein EZS28_013762 [Streblomastix strix]
MKRMDIIMVVINMNMFMKMIERVFKIVEEEVAGVFIFVYEDEEGKGYEKGCGVKLFEDADPEDAGVYDWLDDQQEDRVAFIFYELG